MVWLLMASALGGDLRVVGGHPAAAGDWPDAAAVMFGKDQGCTGVLVAPDVVLTAGHCAGGIKAVRLNVTDYDDLSTGEEIRVTKTTAYPGYWGKHDIAVLKLERASVYPPRRIALDCVLDEHLSEGAEVAVVGWGATDVWGNDYGTILMEAFTTVTDPDCSEMPGCWGVDDELGAGGDGIDACYGDSGGPLYLLTDDGAYVVGLTSRSYDGVDKPCEEGGIYTRPDAVVAWIESTAGVTLERPDCGTEGNRPPEPTADAIVVEQGAIGTTTVRPGDPDGSDTHAFVVIAPPQHGTAEVDGLGVVTYFPDADFVGADDLVVLVTDGGGLFGEAPIAVEVTASTADTDAASDTDEIDTDNTRTPDDDDLDGEIGGGCGCAAVPSPAAGFALLALVPWLLRRRPRTS